MKRIVICCDGTWNTPDRKEKDISCPTNVAKIAELIAPVGGDGIPQLTYYLHGVGTGDLGDKIVGGISGVGLSKNIQYCYRFLVSNYAPGDQLWLFGFSRGSYTARSLVGLINNSGLLNKKDLDRLPEAYQLYRDRGESTHPKSEKAKKFRGQFSLPEDQVEIHFLGVWDTVGSLGVPGRIVHKILDKWWEFHDVTLSSMVKNAYQALAIDERREDFKPCLWSAPSTTAGEQVWFAGAHSDIGGGYPEAGLSDCALAWMLCKAEGCGLTFDYRNVSVKPDLTGKLHNSKKRIFKFRGDYAREIGAQPVSKSAMERTVKMVYRPKRWPQIPALQQCSSGWDCPRRYKCF